MTLRTESSCVDSNIERQYNFFVYTMNFFFSILYLEPE